HQADHGGTEEGGDDRAAGEHQAEFAGDAAEHRAEGQRAEHAQGAADQADQHRLDQELPEDVALPRTDRHAHADFAGTLGDRDQHDVHHPNAADHQRNQRDHRDQQGHGAAGLLDGLADGVGVHHEEILHAVAAGEQADDALLGGVAGDRVVDAHGDALQV